MTDWILALLVLVAGGIGSSGKDLLTWVFGFAQKETTENAKQETEIAILKEVQKISSNELQHIRIQIEENSKEHTEIKVILARIEGKLEK